MIIRPASAEVALKKITGSLGSPSRSLPHGRGNSADEHNLARGKSAAPTAPILETRSGGSALPRHQFRSLVNPSFAKNSSS